MQRALSGLFLLFLILLLSVNKTAMAEQIVEATGSAGIKNGAQHIAKEKAIKNAMQQALMQNKSHIDSTSTISANVIVIDSARVNTSGTIEKVKVIKEWVKDNVYFVRIRASIPENLLDQYAKKIKFRKKIAVMQFDILHRAQVYDLPNIERELPQEILRRLNNSGEFITIDATQYLASPIHPGMRFDAPDVYKMIAEKTSAQFVLSGQIRDMQVTPGFFRDKRNLEIEIYLHDGLSGTPIAKHRYSEVINNAGLFEIRKSLFSSADFFKTNIGKSFHKILQSQVAIIREDLRDIPFSAKVIKISDKKVYFNAGRNSLVNVGDVLMTYRLEADPLSLGNVTLGRVETPVASMAVEQVQAQFSIGKLEIDNAELSPGDIIRFGQ